MGTYAILKASLKRTSESLERLQNSRVKVYRRIKGLDNRLIFVRDALETTRGQSIRGEITRALRVAAKTELDLEVLTVRAERLQFKARNLQLDAKFNADGPTGHSKEELVTQAEKIQSVAVEYLQSYEEWLLDVRDKAHELKRYSINAEWHYKIDLCIDSFRAGYDERGLTNLLFLVYGPNTPADHRRRALDELLSWGHTIQNLNLIRLATSHLAAYSVPLDRYSASDRELVLRIEGQKLLHPFEHQDGLLLLLDAIKRGTEDAFLAAANWAARADLPEVEGFGRKLQVEWINRALAVHELEPIHLNPELSDTPFDQVDCDIEPATQVTNGALVSVIIPAWNSGKWLPTAVRSLQKQSWKNLEIIIVDDCSSDDTLAVAKSLAAKDSRIKVLANKTNRGAYASRNWGLEVSTGQFITVHDADDWSHPRKIERQVFDLIQNPDIVANLSQSVRIEPDNLMFFAQYGREIMRQNSSSVLFSRDTVFAKLGYWDEVKFGADTEFHHRIRSAFGPDSAPVARNGLLSLTRYHAESLTGGGKHSTQRGIVGARRDYLRKFDDWHAKGKSEGTSLYLERAVVDRPFPIPISSADAEYTYAHFDLVIFANLAITTDWISKVYLHVKKLCAEGKRVAFLNLPGLLRPTQQPSEAFEQLLVETGAIRIYTSNNCEAERVWIQASSLAARNVLLPEVKALSPAEIIVDDPNLEVDLDSAVALASEYVGSKALLFVANRECKLSVASWHGTARPATTLWKPVAAIRA